MTPPAQDLMIPLLVVFVGTAVALFCLLAALTGGRGRNREFRRRVARAAGKLAPATSLPATAVASIRLQETGGLLGRIERAAVRLLPSAAALRVRLARTGYPISLGAYGVASLALTVIATFAAWMVLAPPSAVAIGILVGVGIPHLVVERLAQQRAKRFLALFPEAIELMVRGIRSGLPVTEEIGVIGQEIADPVGEEFRKVAQAVRFGQTLEDALWEAARRLDIPDFKFFVVSLSVQRETGGNLAETLDNLSEILRRRQQMKLKIKAMSSEAKASATILGSLPFLMLMLLMVINPDYAMVLIQDPRGRLLGLVGLCSLGMGLFVMSRMVRFEI